MIDPTNADDLEGRIAVQVNAIVGDAMRESFRWAANQLRGVSYCPPLLRGDLDMMEINLLAEQARARR
jgi:hypothetical protein